jgi:hypothetical protein
MRPHVPVDAVAEAARRPTIAKEVLDGDAD